MQKTINKSMILAMIASLIFSCFGVTNSVYAATNIDSCNISLAYTEFTVDGSGHYPKVTITNNGTTLKKNTDYTVKYRGGKKAGTSYIYIEGIGSYSGKTERTYIGKDPSADSSSKKETQRVTGFKQTNAIKAYYLLDMYPEAKTAVTARISYPAGTSDAKLFKNGNKYTFIARKPGTYHVTFTAEETSQYMKAEETSVISVTNSWDKKSAGFKLTAKSKAFYAKFRLNPEASKYRLYYKATKNGSWKYINISREKAEKNWTNGSNYSPNFNVKGLKADTSYTVKLKAYVNGSWVTAMHYSEKQNKYIDYKKITTN